ncbi:NAD(P)-dependent oxidoreductase [Chrysiogenes arsenatis]|uniref:NAD(P)-dependent oxidoreductase n=1 Tax=Chrysiogenes arsenatis TaxID=309797 RepID=UPI0003FB3785|nr:NAD(P)-dependent oxidoreductase [Chrysiogenes arsenatis]
MKLPYTLGITSAAFAGRQDLVEKASAIFDRMHLVPPVGRLPEKDIIAMLQHCDAAIVGLDKITPALLQQCPRVKVISKFGVGLDNIDVAACEQRGVRVLAAFGVNRRSVAELTLNFMLSLIRNCYRSATSLKAGQWVKNGGRCLTEKKIGIIGVGNIGKEVIHLLQPFQCEILANDILDLDVYYAGVGAKSATKDEIFRSCDIITLHTPLTPQTQHMVTLDSLKRMKNDAFLINTARGGIVKTEDLKEALRQQLIAGAALDVFEVEPFYDDELLNTMNVLCTPHIGGNAQEAVFAMGESALNLLVNHYGR